MASISSIKVSIIISSVKIEYIIRKLDPKTDDLRTLSRFDPTASDSWTWNYGMPNIQAAKGTSIAAIWHFDAYYNGYSFRVYYQDPELYLRECFVDRSTFRWVFGEQIIFIYP